MAGYDGGGKLANALNERFVAADLDRVVPKETNAVHTVGEKVEPWRRTGSIFLGVPREPPQGVVNRADYPSVVVWTRSSYPVELRGVCNDGSPQRGLRVVGAVSKHPPPCRPPEECESDPSVHRTKSGECSGSAQRNQLSHILFRLLPGFKPLEVAQYPDRVRLGLLP